MIKLPYFLILLFILSQIIILAIFGYTPYPDSEGYIALAHDCLKYGDLYPNKYKLHDLAFIWNIGAIDMVIFSLRLFKSVLPLLILYSIIKGLTAFLVYQIANKLFNYRVALLSLILYVIYPANYGEATSLQSEVPNIFLSILGLWLIICKDKNILGGGIIGIANWFRPIGIVFLISILIYKYRKILSVLLGYIIVVCIIGSASYYRTGHFIYQAETGWMALLQYSVDNTKTITDDKLPIINNLKTNVADKDKIWRQRFFYWLSEHSIDYVSQIPYKMLKMFVSDNVNMCAFVPNKEKKDDMYIEINMRSIIHNFPNYSPVQILTIINLLYYYFLLIIFIISCFNIKKWKDKVFGNRLLLSLIFIYTLMIITVGHGEARFHHQIMPYIIIVDGAMLLSIVSRYKKLSFHFLQ